MRMSHFSKEFCNKLVLCHNVIKELTLASALFWVSISSHISFRESDLILPKQLSLLQSSIYSLLAAWVTGSALIPTYPFGSIQLHCLSLALASAFGHLPMKPHTPPSTSGIQQLYSIKSVRLGIILTRFRIVLKKKKKRGLPFPKNPVFYFTEGCTDTGAQTHPVVSFYLQEAELLRPEVVLCLIQISFQLLSLSPAASSQGPIEQKISMTVPPPQL